MNFDTLGKYVTNSYIFKGSEQMPFLAPRGVFTAKNHLFVSDTGCNRIFIWKEIPTSEYQEPDIILGQSDVLETGRNSGGKATANTLHYPSGIWSNGAILIVADAWNHRVLIWHSLPTQSGQAADVVLGQPDFESNQTNVSGIGNDPTAQTLNWPYGVFSDGQRLWIADTGNRRILFYHAIPTENYAPADKVIGKPTFTTRDYNNNEPIWPYSIKINSKGQMAVADTQFYRVLVWNKKENAFSKPADIIIGQDNFDACGQNQFRLTPEANTLNWTYDACFYKDGILVNDTGNSRILKFDEIPSKNNALASTLIGREDFNTSSEFKGNMHGTNSAIYWPFSITTEGDTLFIADTGNHRIVITTLKS
jgi:sugar lactone lactonase YvrE